MSDVTKCSRNVARRGRVCRLKGARIPSKTSSINFHSFGLPLNTFKEIELFEEQLECPPFKEQLVICYNNITVFYSLLKTYFQLTGCGSFQTYGF